MYRLSYYASVFFLLYLEIRDDFPWEPIFFVFVSGHVHMFFQCICVCKHVRLQWKPPYVYFDDEDPFSGPFDSRFYPSFEFCKVT